AAQSVGGCQLDGTASFSPGLGANAQNFSYSFHGGLSGCQSSEAGSPASGTWADGTKTVIDYSTSGAAAAVHLDGTVASSVTLQAINPQPGQPTSTTVTTTRYAGDSSQGLLTFQPPDPTACNTPAGVTSAAIGGAVGLGSTS